MLRFGEQHDLCGGMYNIQMDRAFIQALVNLTAALVEVLGQEPLSQLCRKTSHSCSWRLTWLFGAPAVPRLCRPASRPLEGSF